MSNSSVIHTIEDSLDFCIQQHKYIEEEILDLQQTLEKQNNRRLDYEKIIEKYKKVLAILNDS